MEAAGGGRGDGRQQGGGQHLHSEPRGGEAQQPVRPEVSAWACVVPGTRSQRGGRTGGAEQANRLANEGAVWCWSAGRDVPAVSISPTGTSSCTTSGSGRAGRKGSPAACIRHTTGSSLDTVGAANTSKYPTLDITADVGQIALRVCPATDRATFSRISTWPRVLLHRSQVQPSGRPPTARTPLPAAPRPLKSTWSAWRKSTPKAALVSQPRRPLPCSSTAEQPRQQ